MQEVQQSRPAELAVNERLNVLDKKIDTVDRHVKCLTLVDGGTLTLQAMVGETT